jgi:hypothetical protein
MRGKLDTGDEHYEAALRLNPRYPYLLFTRTIAETKKGNTANASEDIAAAKAINATIGKEFVRYGVQ